MSTLFKVKYGSETRNKAVTVDLAPNLITRTFPILLHPAWLLIPASPTLKGSCLLRFCCYLSLDFLSFITYISSFVIC